jgi:hypothetical protein
MMCPFFRFHNGVEWSRWIELGGGILVLSLATSLFRPRAACLGLAALTLMLPTGTVRSFGQTPKISVDALTAPARPPLRDREIAPTAHQAAAYGTPQTTPAPPPPVAAPPPQTVPVYSAAPQVPVVVSPSPTPVMIQPGPTTVLIGQTPPPNIIFAGNAPSLAAPNLMMLAPQQPAVAMTTPSPQGVTTSATVQYLMAQPAAQPQQPQVTAIVLHHRGPICSAIGALGRSMARLGQPTVEMSSTPILTQAFAAPAPQPVQYAAPVAATAAPQVAEPPHPSPQSEPGHKWKLFRR